MPFGSSPFLVSRSGVGGGAVSWKMMPNEPPRGARLEGAGRGLGVAVSGSASGDVRGRSASQDLSESRESGVHVDQVRTAAVKLASADVAVRGSVAGARGRVGRTPAERVGKGPLMNNGRYPAQTRPQLELVANMPSVSRLAKSLKPSKSVEKIRGYATWCMGHMDTSGQYSPLSFCGPSGSMPVAWCCRGIRRQDLHLLLTSPACTPQTQ